MDAALLQRVERWLDGDPDVHDRARIEGIDPGSRRSRPSGSIFGATQFWHRRTQGPIQAGPRG